MLRRKSLIYWILGLLILSVVLYFFIFRYSGYIYYFDSAGSFGMRRPFDQYWFTYTPYDGVEVGIKNRLPLISLFQILATFLQTTFHLDNSIVIQLAYAFLFYSAYTAFFYTFPRFLNRFYPHHQRHESETFELFRMILSLLYLIVPYFVFRESMLHMFYFVTFYPLITDAFLRLLESERFNLRLILTLTVLCFFGFTYINILYYYIVTFLILGTIFLISQRHRGVLIVNALIAGVLVLLTNIYWVIPYFLKGAPQPGYVVTEIMVAILSSYNSLFNVIVDSAEWFLDIPRGVVVFVYQYPLVSMIQLVGLANMYLLGVVAAVNAKRKEYVWAAVIFSVISILVVAKESPVYKWLFENFVYWDFGWIIREPNRQRAFLSFWSYLLFAVGVVLPLFDRDGRGHKKLQLPIIFSLFGLITFFVYGAPISYKTFQFLKPIPMHTDLVAVNQVIEAPKEYAYVNYQPSFEWYRSTWLPEEFEIADNIHYQRIIPNSISLPPTHLATVIPVVRTKEHLLSEMAFWTGNKEKTAALFTSLGIKYSVINKNADPMFFSIADNNRVYTGAMQQLFADQKLWVTEYDGNEYQLTRNTLFSKENSFDLSKKRTILVGPTATLFKLSPDSIKNNTFQLLHYDTNVLKPGDRIVKNDFDSLYYLDFLEDEKSFVYPYDYTRSYGGDVHWGKASPLDKGSAELSSVFRYHGIRVFQYMRNDKVAYSDISVKKPGELSRMEFTKKSSCTTDCAIFASVLFSHKGGQLSISIDSNQTIVQTDRTFHEGFYWTEIARHQNVNEQMRVILENSNGLGAIGSILVVSEADVEALKKSVSQYEVINLGDSEDRVLPSNQSSCVLETAEYYDTAIPSISIKGFCPERTTISLKQFKNEFQYKDLLSGKQVFTNAITVEGSFSGKLSFYSSVDLILWVFFGTTVVGIAVILVLLWVLRKKGDN